MLMADDAPAPPGDLAAAVAGLEQAVSGITDVLRQHGAMLNELLRLATEKSPEEESLGASIRELVLKLEHQTVLLARIDTGIAAFTTALVKAEGS